MITFVLWLILLFLCWPLALIALVLYPIVWLLLLPFRILGNSCGRRTSPGMGRCHTSGPGAGRIFARLISGRVASGYFKQPAVEAVGTTKRPAGT